MSKCDVYGSHESFEFNCISTVFSFRYVLQEEKNINIHVNLFASRNMPFHEDGYVLFRNR